MAGNGNRRRKSEHSGFVVMHIESTLEAAEKRAAQLQEVGYDTKIIRRRSKRFVDGKFHIFREFRVMAEWRRLL